jgi:dextranase
VTALLPGKATFAPGEEVTVEVRGASESVTLTRLGDVLAEAPVVDGWARFGPLEPGGYGIEAAGAHSALDVLEDPLSRPRYGFVSHYETGRDATGVVENARRLHLNAVQFYDWMYRHADLIPPADAFRDALGQELSLDSVRRLADSLAAAGSLPFGYAAVYAAGADEWASWKDEGLFHDDGEPWMLADFLWIVDPSSERWMDYFASELSRAAEVGFAGFHLDQYGAPKLAVRRDGRRIDLAEAFPALLRRVHELLPEARLIFNNVNDFPTWATAPTPVAAVYIEVWSPHERLGDLGALIARARAFGQGKPVILATYLEPYRDDDTGGRAAEQLMLATVFSHGATALVHGEEQAVLVDPYYVRHAVQSAESLESTRRLYDFAVRHGDLIFDPRAVDVTGSFAGGINQEIVVEAPVPVSVECAPGSLWVRVVSVSDGLLVHLIDLSSQSDDRWNAPKGPGRLLEGVRLRIERAGGTPKLRVADPFRSPTLRPLDLVVEARHVVAEVPPFETWALIWCQTPFGV